MSRLLHLAAMAGEAPVYVVHLSSAAGQAEVRKARAQRQKGGAWKPAPSTSPHRGRLRRPPEGLEGRHAPRPLRNPGGTATPTGKGSRTA